MKDPIQVRFPGVFVGVLLLISQCINAAGDIKKTITVEANCVAEIALTAELTSPNPFKEITVDAIVTTPDGRRLKMPTFWAGGNEWRFRYASGSLGIHTFRTECSDSSGAKLHGVEGTIEVVPYRGENPLYRHGKIQVAKDNRHFEHADGTPFFWLGDTWWKNLCKRMTWEGFHELTLDRKTKGFTVVQIVCGPYPDEDMLEPRWKNEGGMPYKTRDLSEVNTQYFDYADRRIKHLVENGIVPAIVGGWGREQAGGKSTLNIVGAPGYKRHWRHLIARYGAYPVIWILGGEASDAQGPWSEVGRYLKDVDPYRHPLTYHAQGHPRQALRDNAAFDFDMIAIGHNSWETAGKTLELIKSCLSAIPARPALNGEACYEGHMQTNFEDVQRHLFWSCMLSGAAGHTYGAAGVWHASIEGDPGITPVYDLTTWEEGMRYPGSTQIGLGKKLLEQYPWWRFKPYAEWVEPGCYAAGIPGEVRVIYMPRRNIYNWSGPVVKNLETDIDWHAFYFDPATGRKMDQGVIKARSKSAEPTSKFLDFKRDVPSPRDWVLVFERVLN